MSEAIEQVQDWITSEQPLPPLKDLSKVLAELPLVNYLEARASVLKRVKQQYHVTAKELDQLVGLARKKLEEADLEAEKQGTSILKFEEIEPWPEAVNGEALFDELRDVFTRHMVLSSPSYSVVLALWVAETYMREWLQFAPYLGVSSPAPNCGKTTLMTILKYLSFKSLVSSNISPASMFRIVNICKPTLLVDEFDTFIKHNGELMGILNCGHDREMAAVIRCVGDEIEPRLFDVFGPKAWAMIGMPEQQTLVSRSFIIRLMRKKHNEHVEEFEPKKQAELTLRLRRQLKRWTDDNAKRIDEIEPRGLSLENRDRDNWSILFRIAEVAGPRWLSLVQDACQKFGEITKENEKLDDATTMLIDILNIFHTHEATRISRDDLYLSLLRQKDSPWARWSEGGRELNTFEMVKFIREKFDIATKSLYKHLPDGNRKKLRGYERSQFEDVHQRFAPNWVAEEVDVTALRDLTSVKDRTGNHFGLQSDLLHSPSGVLHY